MEVDRTEQRANQHRLPACPAPQAPRGSREARLFGALAYPCGYRANRHCSRAAERPAEARPPGAGWTKNHSPSQTKRSMSLVFPDETWMALTVTHVHQPRSERVEFISEPTAVEKAFRGSSSSTHASPKLWADAYLTAFAGECGGR